MTNLPFFNLHTHSLSFSKDTAEIMSVSAEEYSEMPANSQGRTIFLSVGLHPWSVDEEWKGNVEKIEHLISRTNADKPSSATRTSVFEPSRHYSKNLNPDFEDCRTHLPSPSIKIAAIGECGLDYAHASSNDCLHITHSMADGSTEKDMSVHNENIKGIESQPDPTYRILQQEAFRAQIRISEKYKLPMIIHCVKAIDDLLRIRKVEKTSMKWIFHGFRGKPQQALQLLGHGIDISFGSRYNEESVKAVPLDSLWIETDTADISIDKIYSDIARLKNISIEELKRNIINRSISAKFINL